MSSSLGIEERSDVFGNNQREKLYFVFLSFFLFLIAHETSANRRIGRTVRSCEIGIHELKEPKNSSECRSEYLTRDTNLKSTAIDARERGLNFPRN